MSRARHRMGDPLASEAMLSFYAEGCNWRMNGDRFSYRLGHRGGRGAVQFSRRLLRTIREVPRIPHPLKDPSVKDGEMLRALGETAKMYRNDGQDAKAGEQEEMFQNKLAEVARRLARRGSIIRLC